MEQSGLRIDWYKLLRLAYENHMGGLVNRLSDMEIVTNYPDQGKMDEASDRGWNEFCLSLEELGIDFDDSHRGS